MPKLAKKTYSGVGKSWIEATALSCLGKTEEKEGGGKKYSN